MHYGILNKIRRIRNIKLERNDEICHKENLDQIEASEKNRENFVVFGFLRRGTTTKHS